MKDDEFADLDAVGQAELVRKKQVEPIELVEAAIARIERTNPKLNAVVCEMFEIGREEARNVPPDAPLAGVPYLLKDLFASYAGVPMTSGSRFLKDYVPDHDSELVSRLRRAGLVIIGKTNLSEFGLVPTSESALLGPARNPWDVSRSTGGSSGGAAAAVAAGMVHAAHAADGGGSIRIPASCCGVFGLKPTRARNPLGPDLGDISGGLVSEHAVTRSVRDSAALLDTTSGPDIGDPYWAPMPVRPYSQEVGANPGKLKIAYTTGSPSGKIHPDCEKAVLDAASLCTDLGHEVVEDILHVDFDSVYQAFSGVWAVNCAWGIDSMALLTGRTPTEDQFEPLTWTLYKMGQEIKAASYLITTTLLQALSRSIASFFQKYDIVLTSTLGEPPVPLGSFDSTPEDPLRGLVRAAEFICYTPLANITGQPAMSVPLYWNEDGLPVGTQFIARFGDEATLFRLASQLEEARPWAGRSPGL